MWKCGRVELKTLIWLTLLTDGEEPQEPDWEPDGKRVAKDLKLIYDLSTMMEVARTIDR